MFSFLYEDIVVFKGNSFLMFIFYMVLVWRGYGIVVFLGVWYFRCGLLSLDFGLVFVSCGILRRLFSF